MQADPATSASDWIVPDDQPVISVPMVAGGEAVVRFTTDNDASTPDLGSASLAIARVLRLAGAWDDLDADQVFDELDQLRHASPPADPFTLDSR